MNTGCSHKDPNPFTGSLRAAPNLRAEIQRPRDDRKGDSVALVEFLLMLLWGREPQTRRPPRVLLERVPRSDHG